MASTVQEELDVVPALLAMLDSPVAALRAKALVCCALLMQTHPAFLLEAFQAKLSHQVRFRAASLVPMRLELSLRSEALKAAKRASVHCKLQVCLAFNKKAKIQVQTW